MRVWPQWGWTLLGFLGFGGAVAIAYFSTNPPSPQSNHQFSRRLITSKYFTYLPNHFYIFTHFYLFLPITTHNERHRGSIPKVRRHRVRISIYNWLRHRNRELTGNSGEDVRKLFKFAQQKGFAIPAINVTSSSTVNASLEAARDAKSPVILQVSQGGAAYFAGKGNINPVKAMPSERN